MVNTPASEARRMVGLPVTLMMAGFARLACVKLSSRPYVCLYDTAPITAGRFRDCRFCQRK